MTGNVVILDSQPAAPRNSRLAYRSLQSVRSCWEPLPGAASGRTRAGIVADFLALSTYAQTTALAAALLVSLASFGVDDLVSAYALVVLLAFAMGLQNATARRLGVADLTTTVLTLTITGLAADSGLAGGAHPHTGRRLLAIAAMFVGAFVGAVLVLGVSVSAALAVALVLLLSTALAGYRFSSSTEAWTAGK